MSGGLGESRRLGELPLVDDPRLFEILYPGLRRFAAAVAPFEMDPDDLLQEAVSRALVQGRLTDLRDPGAYLRVTMVRLASNERRRLGRWRRALARAAPVEEPWVGDYPSDLGDLDRLSPEDRALLYLTVVEAFPLGEVARLLGRSEGAMRMRRHRALRALRNALAKEEQDG